MLRSTIIVTTIVAIIIGSLGLPVDLHVCSMSARVEAKPECPMCRKHEQHNPSRDDSEQGMRIKAPPCCVTHQFIQQTNLSTLVRTEQLPAPVSIAVIALFLHEQTPVSTLASAACCDHHPPSLAARSQSTYLFNSTFLI